MLDTGKDAIDVTATVTAKVGEEAVNKSAKGLAAIIKLLLKLLEVILQKIADKVVNKNGMRKIKTLMKSGDTTSYVELPAGLDQKDFQKQMHKQGKRLAFQFNLTKSGDNCILTYKDKDAQVVALAYKNLQREAINKNKVMPDIEISNAIQAKEQQENIKVSRDQEGNFVYSRGDLSITSKGEKGEAVRQRLQDTFGISERSAWAVWNQGLDLSKNEKVAKRRSIRGNISKAQEKQQADIQASKQAPKAMTQSTPAIAPAARMTR